MADTDDEDPAVRRVRGELWQRDRVLLGPETLPQDPTGERNGWFAPVVILGRGGGASVYGWGETPAAAAEDALAHLPPEPTAP